MKLENGGGNGGGDRPFHYFLQDIRLALSLNDHQNLLRGHNGADAHGICKVGDFIRRLEETGVSFDGAGSQLDLEGGFAVNVTGLIKADMSVVAQAEELKVNLPQGGDEIVIPSAFDGIVGLHSVGNIGIVQINVDMFKKILIHKVIVAAGVILGKPYVFVQIDGSDPGEIQISFVLAIYQILIGADRGRTGSKAENAVRLENDLCCDDIGSLSAHVLVISCSDNSHNDLHLPGRMVWGSSY